MTRSATSRATTATSCDAVLLLGFGGPESPEQVRPFLAHVLRGRPVPASRIEEVAHHYAAIGGSSPFKVWTERQRTALEAQLGARVPIHVGMWHTAPFCVDVLRELSERGVRDVLVLIMAAFHDQTTLQRYHAVVDEALAELAPVTMRVRYARSPEHWNGFYQAGVEHIRAAQAALPGEVRDAAKLLFTAHSVPTTVGMSSGYVASYERAAGRIARELGVPEFDCVYQSRSGSPRDSWLEPDVCDALRREAAAGTRAVVLAPIGFVCDHVEVLYDLDIEAQHVAQQLGLTMTRAATAGTHPAYISALVESVREALSHAPAV